MSVFILDAKTSYIYLLPMSENYDFNIISWVCLYKWTLKSFRHSVITTDAEGNTKGVIEQSSHLLSYFNTVIQLTTDY